jgi:3-deoxy-D-manno-octulosonate 8-phosphate phosphatase (KDO 8-P phosphatase)
MKPELVQLFEEIGGEFLTSPVQLKQRWSRIKAFVFDWDGVFNTGTKGVQVTSHFTEADSMGTNLLRFSFWLNHNKQLPVCAIITGQNNVSAIHLGEREHFHAVYTGYKHKLDALETLLSTCDLRAEEIMFVYDDVLDVSIARKAGVRMLINRFSSPCFSSTLLLNILRIMQHPTREVSMRFGKYVNCLWD